MPTRPTSFPGARRTTTAIGVAWLVCGASGCPDCVPLSTWDGVEVALDIEDDLNAVLIDEFMGASPVVHIVGQGGAVVRIDDEISVQRPSDRALRGIAQTSSGLLFVVGDGGVILGSEDQGSTWEAADSGTTSALQTVVAVPSSSGDTVVAAGVEVMLVRTPLTGEWTAVEPPPDGWGDLLLLTSDDPHILALGRRGVMWQTLDPRGSWTGVPTGVAADLRVAGRVGSGEFVVAGAAGTILVREQGSADVPRFRTIETAVEAGFVAFAAGDLDDYLLDEEGRVYETHGLIAQHELELLFDAGFPARAMDFEFAENPVSEIGGGDHVLVIVGVGGRVLDLRLNCEVRCNFGEADG